MRLPCSLLIRFRPAVAMSVDVAMVSVLSAQSSQKLYRRICPAEVLLGNAF